jgi:hypothetical protein
MHYCFSVCDNQNLWWNLCVSAMRQVAKHQENNSRPHYKGRKWKSHNKPWNKETRVCLRYLLASIAGPLPDSCSRGSVDMRTSTEGRLDACALLISILVYISPLECPFCHDRSRWNGRCSNRFYVHNSLLTPGIIIGTLHVQMHHSKTTSACRRMVAC